jgi:hypothetical protein
VFGKEAQEEFEVGLLKKYRGNLQLNFAIHEHNTSSKCDLHTQFCNTSLFRNSAMNRGVKLYKYLPSKIENWKTLTALEKSKTGSIEKLV